MMNEIFICKQCGMCCQGETTVSLDEYDQQVMLEYLGISREEALAKYWRCRDGQIQMQTQNGHCIFYADGCTVHTAKPWRCRQWPLVPAIALDSANFSIIRNSCPGISREISFEELCSFMNATLHSGQ